MNDAEKINIINKLILESAKDFWNWEMAYYRLKQMDNAVVLASIRFDAVKQRVVGGDEAAIDSIEAKIFLLDRQNLRLQAFVDYQNAIIKLSNYLWTSDKLPLSIDTTIIPAKNLILGRLLSTEQVQNLYEQAKKNHPKLIALNSKIEIHRIEQRLLKNNLLPALVLNYNFINTPADFSWNNNLETAFRNNYKYGFTFYYPLLLRKERGKLQMNTIKLYQLNQEYTQTERDILNSIEMVYNDFQTVISQIVIQNQQVVFTNTLLYGERDKFFNGESTLFLVNTREVTMINAELKLIELNNKAVKTISELYWSAGLNLTE
jgi:outer membrane protein TolC